MRTTVTDVEQIIKETDKIRLDSNQLVIDHPTYKYLIRSDAARAAYIINLLPPLSQLKVCEIGVGYGHIAIPLCKTCVDASVFAIEAPTREYVNLLEFNKMIKQNNIDLRLADITKDEFPFEDESFHVVIFSEIIEHLSPTALPRIFGEIKRCLKKDGQVIVTTPNLLRFRNRIRFLLGRPVFENPTKLVGGTFGHIREYSNQEVIDLLRMIGFSEIIAHRTRISYPIMLTFMDRVVSRLGYWIARISINFEDFVFVSATR